MSNIETEVQVLPDDIVRILPVTDAYRERVRQYMGEPTDAEAIAFRRGAFAYLRHEPGDITASAAVYPQDMNLKVAWRTGWLVFERLEREGNFSRACDSGNVSTWAL